MKISSTSQLHIGATYVIGATVSGTTYEMSSTQNNNNRPSNVATMNSGKIVESESTGKFELVAGHSSVEGSYGFKALNGTDSGGYLTTASSSSNYLRTSTTLNANSWAITFSGADVSVIAQGNYTRNIMRFNAASDQLLFAAYSSGQQPIDLYLDETTIPNPDAPSVVITSTDPRLSVGGTATLVATTENAEGVLVSWSSDNEQVATINSSTGLVTGVAVGSATITAKITVDEVDYTHTLVITIVQPTLMLISPLY